MVGATNVNDPGAAYAFTRAGSAWTLEALLTAWSGNVAATFGESVALDGERAVIGAWQDTAQSFAEGTAYVFDRDGGAWTGVARLIRSAGGITRHGRGTAVAGDKVFVGLPYSRLRLAQVGAWIECRRRHPQVATSAYPRWPPRRPPGLGFHGLGVNARREHHGPWSAETVGAAPLQEGLHRPTRLASSFELWARGSSYHDPRQRAGRSYAPMSTVIPRTEKPVFGTAATSPARAKPRRSSGSGVVAASAAQKPVSPASMQGELARRR
ncbi:MAG: hypothetical protein GY711_27805 [bacterium]|nr:hypothetical protein [bacterium]